MASVGRHVSVFGVTEEQIEQYLCQRVKAIGGECIKFTSPGRAGVPDRLVVLPFNRFYLCEVKKPTGRIRALQWIFATKVMLPLGVNVEFLWCKEEVDKFIERVKP